MMTETEKKYDFTPEEKMLVQLREELYQGSWEKFIKDLKDRQKDRPYIFKLQNRIKEDLERIDKLQRYEFNSHVNLAELLKEQEPSEN